MLGDSTMAPYDENATNTRGWGMYFGNFLTDGWTSINYAKGGRDSRGGYNELWQNAKNSVEAGDYVLIQFAHNDEKYNGIDNLELQEYYTAQGDATNAAAVKSDGRGTTPSTTYKECLTQIINEVKAKGAIPVLVSAVCRCYFSGGTITRAGRHDLGAKYDAIIDGAYKSGLSVTESDHTMDYSYHMQQLATELNVAFVDMTTATKNLYESYGTYDKCYAALFDKGGTADNTHYNLTGALTAARMCAQMMKEQGILADHIEISADLSVSPSTADLGEAYVGQAATKELTLSGLGLNPATGTVTVTATTGILLSTDKQNWSSSFTVNYENGTLIKTFYAKVNITSVGVFNGTITATTGTQSVSVPISVNGIELGGGDPFTVTWPLTSNDDPTISGNASAAAAKTEGMVKYGNNSQKGLMVSTSESGTWVKAEDDSPNQYVQFTVTAPDGRNLDINHIAMKVGAHGGGGMRCHVYYSTDGFVTRTTIYDSGAMTSGVMNDVEATPVIKLEEGEQLQIRIYPWYTGNATGKWLCVSDVEVSGQSKDAAGVNITGTITYTMEKGTLDQGDDAVMNPTELNAGFAAKKWSYDGDADVTIGGMNFIGTDEVNTKMTALTFNGATSETLSTTADKNCTLTLTLTPEDGFTFVPTKVSFLAGKFNSGNPHLTFAVEAGTVSNTILNNVELNRSKTTPRVDPSSFTEALNGYTATSDSPLKLHFSFLNVQGTRSAGIANVVIEGTLVGAAAQVTKHLLTTQVVPAEAGSITRDPDMDQYKEGSQVTLKAHKNFGFRFVEWQDATGTTVSTEAETIVTMDAEKTMKAVFEAVPVYTVTTKVTNDAEREMGSITLSPNEHQGKYEAGTKITATANESRILKFLSWTDDNENANAAVTRELTVNSDMMLVANYEIQDFIAVFDASTTASYAYQTTAGYPFSADVTWDSNRNAKSSVVKIKDGSLAYTNSDGSGVPVVRNRQQVVLVGINGLFQNGYRSSDIAFQYQFSTKGFTTATFEADMAAKNMAHKNWKAYTSVNGTDWLPAGDGWEMTANTQKPIAFNVPAGQDLVYVRITGDGTDMLSSSYQFNKVFDGLDYTTNSECGVGNVYIVGEAEVEADATAPVVTATVPESGATGIGATGKITISYDERIEPAVGAAQATLTAKGGATVNMTPTWSNRSVSFDYDMLDYGTEYTFQMPANYVQDKSGNKATTPVTITFTTMERPTIDKGAYDVVVSSSEELSAAINEANGRSDKTTRYRIFLKRGTYQLPQSTTETILSENGQTYPSPITYIKASNISFIGEDRDETIITNTITDDTYNGSFGTVSVYERIGYSDVLQIQGGVSGTYFQDVTIKSGIGDKLGRNIAINDRGTKTICKNTTLWAYQDTYISNNSSGLFYFEDGIIRGRTDFICGSGDVFFNKVDIIMCEQGGYVVAPQGNQKFGYVFKDCTIKSNASNVNGNYYLGRAWTNAAETYFINTVMEVQPKVVGWSDWNNGPTRFAEYNSMNSNGAAIDLTGRATTINGAPNNPVLTAEEAATIGNMHNTFGEWQPTLATEQAPVPTNLTSQNGMLTWDDSEYTLLWAVCKDGKVIDFTTTPSYMTTEPGEYSIRAANEMGGLSIASEAVNVSGTTGISDAAYQNNHSEPSDDIIYNLSGRRVTNSAKGLLIVNGKKVVVK